MQRQFTAAFAPVLLTVWNSDFTLGSVTIREHAGLNDQGTMKLVRKNSRTALTLIEVLVVVVVIGVLIALVLPERPRAYGKAYRVACANNLRQVQLGFRLWGQDHDDKFPMQLSVTNGGVMEVASGGNPFPIFQIMSNELNTPKILCCPADEERTQGTNFSRDFQRSNIGYFVNLDAIDSTPDMFLSGDRNLTADDVPVQSGLFLMVASRNVAWGRNIHQRVGNVAFTEGMRISVQTLTRSNLNATLQIPGNLTNHLAMP